MSASTTHGPIAPGTGVDHIGPPSRERQRTGPRFRHIGAIWPATLALFAVSPLIAAGSLGASSIRSMLPFAAVLALAAIGQAFVIQQRGLDLSLPGAMSLGALVVTKVANQQDGKVVVAVALAMLAVLAAGLVNGLVVTRLGITPIVATLGVNALLIGAALAYSGGFPTGAPHALTSLALHQTAGVPNTVLFAGLILSALAALNGRSLAARRLAQAGINPRALRLIGGHVDLLVVSAYMIAAAFYGLAGIMLAAYVQTPGILLGDEYLLPTIAVVVLAGNALTGGQLKVAAIVAAALFLTQLNQVVLSMGAPTSVQLLIQSAALLIAVSGPVVKRRWAGRHRVPGPGAANAEGRPTRRDSGMAA